MEKSNRTFWPTQLNVKEIYCADISSGVTGLGFNQGEKGKYSRPGRNWCYLRPPLRSLSLVYCSSARLPQRVSRLNSLLLAGRSTRWGLADGNHVAGLRFPFKGHVLTAPFSHSLRCKVPSRRVNHCHSHPLLATVLECPWKGPLLPRHCRGQSSVELCDIFFLFIL